MASKLYSLKISIFVQLDLYWLIEKKKYIGTRKKAGAASAKNPDHKITFLTKTTNKPNESPVR